MKIEAITVFVCISIVAISAIAGTTIYNINDRNNMSKNIDAAIAKGIDPLSVKCSYESYASATCITYAAMKK